jgi:hypothetical protein
MESAKLICHICYENIENYIGITKHIYFQEINLFPFTIPL